MKHRVILLVLTLCALMSILSCQRTESNIDLSGDYYPLGFGYEWTYNQLWGSGYTRSIIEQTEINGKMYYRDENDYSKPVRVENNILYFYDRSDDQEYISIDFNKPVGYEWDDPFYDRTLTIISKTGTFDTLDNCIIIRSETAGYYLESTYAPGIGLVIDNMTPKDDIIIINGHMWLRSAIINGETISFEEE